MGNLDGALLLASVWLSPSHCMCEFLHVCVGVYLYVCVFLYRLFLCVYVCSCVSVCTYGSLCVFVHVYVSMCMYTHLHASLGVCILFFPSRNFQHHGHVHRRISSEACRGDATELLHMLAPVKSASLGARGPRQVLSFSWQTETLDFFFLPGAHIQVIKCSHT